jgi:hypothetical protein
MKGGANTGRRLIRAKERKKRAAPRQVCSTVMHKEVSPKKIWKAAYYWENSPSRSSFRAYSQYHTCIAHLYGGVDCYTAIDRPGRSGRL